MPRVWCALAEYLRVWVGLILLAALTYSGYAQPNISGAYQRTITISHNSVHGSDQTDFPVLISGTYPFLANVQYGGNVQSPSGYDILFSSDPDGQNLLNFEIESYDPTTGAVSFWVKIPTLSHTVDTAIYMSYGIPNISTFQGNAAGTWNSNYVSVWHLSEASGTTAYDSTVNANNGTMTNVSSVAGQIGRAAGFNGTTSIVALPHGVTGSSPRTISAWVNSNGQDGCIYCSGLMSSSPYFQAFSVYANAPNTGGVYLQTYGSDQWTAGGVLPLNTWNLVTLAYSGGGTSDSSMSLYVNGSFVTNYVGGWWAPQGTPSTYDGNFTIGSDPALNNLQFAGSIDEVEVSDIARSADWIATEYANQSAPSSFYTVSGAPTLTQLSPSNGMAGTWVTITGTNFGSAQLASTVTFNGTPTIAEIWSDTYLKVLVPDGATSGNVVVTVNGIPSNGLPFTIITIRADLTTVTVSPATASVQAGNTQAFTATATYSDGSTQDVTSVATWSASDPTVAAVDSTGLVTTVDNGGVAVQASVNGITGSAMLTATPGPLDVVLTPVYPTYPATGTNAESGQKAIAIAPDGFARFVVVNSTTSGWASGNYDDEVVYIQCLDQDCTTSHTTTFPTGHTIANYSMALGPNGYAKIATTYRGGVGLIECGNDDCSSSSNSLVDTNGSGIWVSIAVGINGSAFILYDKESTTGGDDAVNLATCSGGSCGIAQLADIPWYDNIGGAVTLGADGNPAVIYEDSGSSIDGTPDSVHYYANGNDVVVSSNGSGSFWVQDIAIGPNGFARLAYVNNQGGVDFIQCTNATCGTSTTATIPAPSGGNTNTVSAAVASDGTGVLQTSLVNGNNTQFWWDYIQCATGDCSKYSDEIAPGSLASGHDLISLALDRNGEAHVISQAASSGTSPGAVMMHGRIGPECPSSVKLFNSTPIVLNQWVPLLKTGVGIIAAMQVEPAINPFNGGNWNGIAITEDVQVIASSDTCPGVPVCSSAGQPLYSKEFVVGCVQGTTTACTPGTSVQAWHKTFSQMDNVFNDQHMILHPTISILDYINKNSCSMSCSQVYYCRKKSVGTFTIDYQLNKDTVSGTPVTSVTAVKH